MLAYRDTSRVVETRRELSRLKRLAASARDGDAAISLLIDVGMFEAGLADADAAARDGWTALTARARDLCVEAARVWIASRAHRPIDAVGLAARLDALDRHALPARITLRVPEGFAYYGVYPETFVEAARACQRDCRARRLAVVGLRSIGTTLSAVVHAACEADGCRVRSYTFRPRGHPFAREVRLDATLAERLHDDAAAGATFLVVDEGPGLSGSSFASAAAALATVGITEREIVFLPSWSPSPEALNSVPGRRAWSAHRRFHCDAVALGITPESLFGVEPGVDYSAGRWRGELFGDETAWPEVEPRHERWKVRLSREGRLLKFAGLGSFGTAARDRALVLADLALGAAPGALRSGFLDQPFVAGTPWSPDADERRAPAIGRYVARVASAFPGKERVEADPLLELIVTNVRELAGDVPSSLLRALDHVRPLVSEARAAEIDGRMLPHEWIDTATGPIKVDGLDHHRDHFFPGAQHPAWDLAAAAVELHADESWIDSMLHAFEREGGDPAARRLLPFYTLAYAAFRAGYATLSGLERSRARYSQCALNAAACFTASSKSPRKQMARSSMNT